VLAVLELLQAHGRLTGPELAQRLEVNIRTLRRYITMLQDLGIPIVAERGRFGAYALSAGFKLPPMMFTNEEGAALAIGLLAARQLGLVESVHAVESARAKLEQVMPHDLKQRVRALTETIALDRDAADGTSASEVIVRLSSAAQQRRTVHLRYRSFHNVETERDFDPYSLAHVQSEWYVVGHCHLRDDLRSFRLDRVQQVEATAARFKRPAHFDAVGYVTEAIASVPRETPYAVLLKTDFTTARHVLREPFGLLEAIEGGVFLYGSTDNVNWLARHLASLPFDFVVRKPKELRVALRRLARLLSESAREAEDRP
jgi:predicted DNA-binding transcriptional regulator YafY